MKKLKTEEDYKAAYEVFNHAMERAARYKVTSRYLEIMQTKYDAMVDDNNQGVYNQAHDPVIIFRSGDVLKSISTKEIPLSVIQDNYEAVKDELAKTGENVKL